MSMDLCTLHWAGSSWICEDDKIAQREGSIFRGQYKKTRYQRESRERRRGEETHSEQQRRKKEVGWGIKEGQICSVQMRRWVCKNLLVDLESGGVGDLRSRFQMWGGQSAKGWKSRRYGGSWVKTGYSWKEFDWSRRKAHLECRVEEVLLVLGVYSSWVSVCVCVCVWGGGWYFSLSLLPFNKQWLELRSWRTGVSQTPPLMGGLLQPPFERETSRDSPLAAIEILIVGALWRKSWKTNWMWRLEAVREPGPGGGWSF